MKENWTYKKLGEVCTIERGGSPRPISDYITDAPDGLNWIKIGDATEGSKYIISTKEKIRHEGLKKTRFVHKGDFILSNSMSFGKPYILDIDGCIHDGWLVIHDDNNTFDKSYLYYLLGSPNMYKEFQRLAVGGVVNNLNSEIVRNVVVAIPPLETQSRIVSELDLLQSIIDKQQAQLKELDKLAQAVFYDMFGDPVENEKGWEVKRLGELCDVYRGGSPRPIEHYLGGTIPWIKIGDATKGDDIYLHQTKEHIIEEGLNKTRYIHSGSLIFANCGVSLGFARIITFNGCIHDGWLAFDNISNEIEKVFLLKSLNFCTQYFRSIAPDGTQPNLNTSIMKSFKQIVPPLTIQKNYIAKIESIEKQKSAIIQSITETQKLFDYTMDKYFG